ncbi:MAG: hypothetical protein WBH44_04355 [Proteocatella sp.]
MNDKDLVQNIMIFLKKKCNYTSQISNYTQDINKSLSQNDLETVEMLLDMRYKVMLEVETCNDDIDIFLNQLSESIRMRIKCQMSESSISSEVSFEESKINEIYLMTRIILKKTIEADKVINAQLRAGLKLSSMDAV